MSLGRKIEPNNAEAIDEKPLLFRSEINKITLYFWLPQGINPGHVSLRTYSAGFTDSSLNIDKKKYVLARRPFPTMTYFPFLIEGLAIFPSLFIETSIPESLEPLIVIDKGIHASFWPDNEIRYKSIFSSHYGVYHTHEDDCIREMRPPDKVIDLYGFDVARINNAYKKFMQSNSKWSLIGALPFGNSQAHNCCSLIAYLLRQGGIGNLDLVDTSYFHTFHFISVFAQVNRIYELGVLLRRWSVSSILFALIDKFSALIGKLNLNPSLNPIINLTALHIFIPLWLLPPVYLASLFELLCERISKSVGCNHQAYLPSLILNISSMVHIAYQPNTSSSLKGEVSSYLLITIGYILTNSFYLNRMTPATFLKKISSVEKKIKKRFNLVDEPLQREKEKLKYSPYHSLFKLGKQSRPLVFSKMNEEKFLFKSS